MCDVFAAVTVISLLRCCFREDDKEMDGNEQSTCEARRNH